MGSPDAGAGGRRNGLSLPMQHRGQLAALQRNARFPDRLVGIFIGNHQTDRVVSADIGRRYDHKLRMQYTIAQCGITL